MPELRCVVYSSIEEISRADWDDLWTEAEEGYGYYRALEAANLDGFAYRYITIFYREAAALIAPVFWTELDLALGVDGSARRAILAGRKIFRRLLVERTLFCGSPFGENGVIGVTSDAQLHPSLLAALTDTMGELCRAHHLRLVMFKDFAGGATPDLSPLVSKGFLRGESFPNVSVALPFKTGADYLASLSYNARKDLKRKLRQSSAAGKITVRVVQDVTDVIDDVYRLYLNSYDAGTVRFEKLTRDYFLGVGKYMRESARFFLFYDSGHLICFNLCFMSGERLIDKFVGFDFAVARELNLYFYTWYHNIEWCIQHGLREYQVGQTDYNEKLRLGGRKIPLFFYAKHRQPLVNFVLRLAARLLMPAC